jgi:hypothetical protein
MSLGDDNIVKALLQGQRHDRAEHMPADRTLSCTAASTSACIDAYAAPSTRRPQGGPSAEGYTPARLRPTTEEGSQLPPLTSLTPADQIFRA